MSDRRKQLEAELLLLGLEEDLARAKSSYRESRTPKKREAFEVARDALQSARTSARLAEGRREGTGVA